MQNSLALLFAHHLWANLRLIEVCRTLSDEQLTYRAPGTYGSIPATLAHIVRAEERYLTFLMGQEFVDAPAPRPDMPLVELQDRARRSGTALLSLATEIQPGTLVRVGEGDEAEMLPAEILFLQALHHAHEHRAQIGTVLGQLGIDPPSLSGWSYYEEEMAPNGK